MTDDVDALVEKGRQARDAAVDAYRELKHARSEAEAAHKKFMDAIEAENTARTALVKMFDNPPNEEWSAMQRDWFDSKFHR